MLVGRVSTGRNQVDFALKMTPLSHLTSRHNVGGAFVLDPEYRAVQKNPQGILLFVETAPLYFTCIPSPSRFHTSPSR